MNSRELLLAAITTTKNVLNTQDINFAVVLETLERLERLLRDHLNISGMFYDEFFYEIVYIVLHKVSISQSEDPKLVLKLDLLMWNLIYNGPPVQSFLLLCKFIKTSSTNLIIFKKVITWLVDLINAGCFKKVLVTYIDSGVDRHFYDFIQFALSLPTVLANKHSGMNFYKLLQPYQYITIIGNDIFSSFTIIHDSLSKNQSVCSLPLSKLIGKICINGYGIFLWKVLFGHLNGKSNTYEWSQMVQEIIANIDDWCFESSIESLLPFLDSYENYDFFFGNLPLTKLKLNFFFTHKFILIKFSYDVKIVRNIMLYLSNRLDLHEHYVNMFRNILETWGKKNFVKHRSVEQILYLSKAIMIGINIAKTNTDFVNKIYNTANETIMKGLPLYLDSSATEIRSIGMVVGQNLALLIRPDNTKLDLPYEKNEITRNLISLLKENFHSKQLVREFNQKKCFENQPNLSANNNCEQFDDKNESSACLIGDGDILQPQDIEKKNKKKMPKYLGQCIEGLLSQEDPEFMEECLKQIIPLAEDQPEQRDLHKELCETLLNLEDYFSTKNFQLIRYQSLLALLILNPGVIAEFLVNEFYKKHYNLKQRMDILDILVGGAKHLSFFDVCTSINNVDNGIPKDVRCTKGQTQLSFSPEQEVDWKLVVQKRLKCKTRFISTKRTVKTNLIQNKFALYAAWFFYPLMKNYDVKNDCMDIVGEDHIILEKLLMSLGTIMYCSVNIPSVSHMAKTLLQFSGCFQQHVEVCVRRAVLFCIINCLIVMESDCSLFDSMDELVSIQSWLNDVESKEWDDKCVQMANQIMPLVEKVKQKL